MCSNDLIWSVNSLRNETARPKDENKRRKQIEKDNLSMIFVLILKTFEQLVKEIRKYEMRAWMNKWNTRDKSDTKKTCIISYSNFKRIPNRGIENISEYMLVLFSKLFTSVCNRFWDWFDILQDCIRFLCLHLWKCFMSFPIMILVWAWLD